MHEYIIDHMRGYNTDGPGFTRAVQSELGFELRDASVLLLGAGGGAGRALATQCAIEGCAKLILVNRTAEKARLLAEELRDYPTTRTEHLPWETSSWQEAIEEVDLIVNTSSLGLKPDDSSPLPASLIPSRTRVFDTVYRAGSKPTPLVSAARVAGALATGGHALLLHQGALAYEHWFDRPAPLEVMRAALQAVGN